MGACHARPAADGTKHTWHKHEVDSNTHTHTYKWKHIIDDEMKSTANSHLFYFVHCFFFSGFAWHCGWSLALPRLSVRLSLSLRCVFANALVSLMMVFVYECMWSEMELNSAVGFVWHNRELLKRNIRHVVHCNDAKCKNKNVWMRCERMY